MARSSVTIIGLPNDRPIHAALFAYDNLPGVGAATFAAGARDCTIPIYAAWSNGKHDPPPRLVALTDHVVSQGLTIKNFIASDGDGKLSRDELQAAAEELYESVHTNPEKTVEVPGLGQRPLIDVLAAIEYSDMRKRTEKRRRK